MVEAHGGQEGELKGRPRAGMREAQRAGRGIKGKTEGRNERGPEGRKGNKGEDRGQGMGEVQRAERGIKEKTEGINGRRPEGTKGNKNKTGSRKGNKREDLGQERESPKGREGE
jgi:hypothetical protein